MEDVLLTGGGIIPADDMTKLKLLGVGELFPPGTDTKVIVGYISDEVNKRRRIHQ
jgi:methylmalonyl-CoA mutase, C-terminal domain